MKINKKILRLSTLILTMTVLTPQSVQAFQPASHYALIRKVSENLDSGSTIKKALDKYPDIAAWGAAGPMLRLRHRAQGSPQSLRRPARGHRILVYGRRAHS